MKTLSVREMDAEHKLALSTFTLLFIILLEGFVTIAVEMLTIRQLITVVGNSVIITSLIIGIFLLFLALGYYKGGDCRGNYRRALKANFTWSALLLGIGLSYTFIQLTFLNVSQLVTSNGWVGLITYLLLITAPLIYLLGQTVPITTNLFRYEQHVGSISGKVLCISTLGSFLGSVVTTVILMNVLGVAWTIFINFLLLVLLILVLSRPREWKLPFVLLACAGVVFLLNVGMERKLFTQTNNYADYQIVPNVSVSRDQTGRLLSINNSPSSFLTEDQKGFDYIETVKKILFTDLKFTNKDILVLGAGGFTLSAQSTHGNRFTYVDIDPALPDIVKNGFIAHINGQFIAEDARRFLIQGAHKYDAVFSDVYSSRYTIPFHLLTKEYFQSVQRVLNPGGVAIFNIIADPMLRDNYSKRVDNTIRYVFKDCMSIPMPYAAGPSNIIYICSARPHVDTTIYTDNLNGSMTDIFKNIHP